MSPVRIGPLLALELIHAKIEQLVGSADMCRCGRAGYDVQSVVSGGYDAGTHTVRQGHGVPKLFVRDDCFEKWEEGTYTREVFDVP